LPDSKLNFEQIAAQLELYSIVSLNKKRRP